MHKALLGVGLTFSGVLFAQDVRKIEIHPATAFNVTKDDIAQLHRLAEGVGWEFAPNDQTNEGLKKIGIKRIRCINVDPVKGKFDDKGEFHVDSDPGYLTGHLNTCRAIGASPHFIIATGLHPDLVVQEKDLHTKDPSIMGMVHTTTFGPKDWTKFRNYCRAVFKYVLIEQKFPDAVFEVANEPDIGGVLVEKPPKPANGSRALYKAYFRLYQNVAIAARTFEEEHPGVRVTLGGPALAWAYTFKFGELNWAENFLRDVRRNKLKLDFVGLHYYGNISPLTGPGGTYPSFQGMYEMTARWRDKYAPGVPIWLTEWGATYHTSLDPQSLHNANHVGAAWSAAFLNQMLVEGVDRALYLVTTDRRQQIGGQWQALWGWPSLFTNSQVHGTHPKAPYHVFQMLRQLAPKRIEMLVPKGTLGGIASRDDRGRLTVLLWNFGYQITEFGPGKELAKEEHITLRIADAGKIFHGPAKLSRSLISDNTSNALYLFQKGEKLDQRCNLQTVDSRTLQPAAGQLEYTFAQPPSSVSFIEIAPAP